MHIKEFSVYGFGKHFKNKVLPALKKFKKIKITNIISRKKNDKNFRIVKKLNKKNSTEYIYISTPISIHNININEAIKTNKVKVIISEKSLTNSKYKTWHIIQQCKKNKILLFESFMYKYHPQFLKIKKLILNIHDSNKNEIFFCRYSIPKIDIQDHRNNNRLTGGEIYEIGCYPISIIYFLFKIDKFKLKKITNIKNIKKGNKQLIYFKLNKLKFILSWGYNSVYRNRIIFKSNNHKIVGEKIFGKRINDNIKIKFNNKKSKKEFEFNNPDNFYFMFKYFFSLENNYKNRHDMYKEINKVAELIDFFKI
tara:strand:+ start:426 stop:1355 length:930 start_codon:yes stop_codon:yes gene_type:complete